MKNESLTAALKSLGEATAQLRESIKVAASNSLVGRFFIALMKWGESR